jgi:D-glycero-D-manno-heptose 1,7-bisphosphate phosphatase
MRSRPRRLRVLMLTLPKTRGDRIREMSFSKPAIFFDRDGTLIQDRGYTYRIEDFAWVTGAPAALGRLHNAGLDIFIVTNQGGIGLGIFTDQDLHRFHEHLCCEAVRTGSMIKDIAFCIHHPNARVPSFRTPCRCRKPEPGMLLDLARKWDVDLRHSVMIGDRQTDVAAGRSAGCHSYLFRSGDLDSLAKEVLNRHFQPIS